MVSVDLEDRVKKSLTKFEFLIEQLLELSNQLPLEVLNSWTNSSYYIARYLDEHADNGAGFDLKSSAMMAAGRLDLLLRETRLTLGGKFTLSDIDTLVDCYQRNIFSPNQIHHIDSDLCNYLDIDINSYEVTSISSLIEKLRSLNTLQRLTLADAIEQFWCQEIRLGSMKPKEFFKSLAIQLN